MAKTWIKATKQFTRRIGAQMVVGHPEHPDPRGRVAEVDEGAQLDNLVSGGYAKKITRKEYLSALEGEVVMAGDQMRAQLAGEGPKASMTMSDGQLQQLAAEKGVTLKGDKRAGWVKQINSKKVNTAADEPEDRWSAVSGDTRDTTLHPQRTGTQADVTDQGTADRRGFSRSGFQTEGETGELAAEEEAPASGSTAKSTSRSTSKGSSSKSSSAAKTTEGSGGTAGTGGETSGSGGGDGSGSA